jgi:predicted DNA-binding ribbon-helix-helix protein
MNHGSDPRDGYSASMVTSSLSEKPSTGSRTTSRRISVGGRIRAVRVPDDLWEEAQQVAEERGETLSAVIRKALQEYVKSGEQQ